MFDEGTLTSALSVLSGKHRIAFAASCCERLEQHYQVFAATEPGTNPNLLKDALQEIWNIAEGTEGPLEHIGEQKRDIYEWAQGVDPTGFLFASTARTAASAVIYALECCADGDTKWAVYAARMAVEALDTYLYVVNAPFGKAAPAGGDVAELRREGLAFDRWIEQSPLMVDELRKQSEDLARLAEEETLTSHSLFEMRQSSQERGIQLHMRGLIRARKPFQQE